MLMLCLLVLQTALAPLFLPGTFYTFTHLALACQRSKRLQGLMVSCILKGTMDNIQPPVQQLSSFSLI